MSDTISVITWWLAIQVLGFAAWPLAARWLHWLPDRGYMLAKPIGLLFVSYGLWLLATLGVIQNSTGGIIVVLIGFAAISFFAYRRLHAERPRGASNLQLPTSNFQFLAWLREHRWLVIAYEAVFAIALIGWAIFRAHNPDLGSTEKPMEFAFFNAIGRSAQFPPADPWLSGYAIAYYYFGYVMMSLLHKLTGVTAGVAFGLSNAFWFALAAASAFGVAANLVLLAAARKTAQRAAIIFGTLGAIMLVLMGNFEASLEVARVSEVASPQFWTQLDVLDLNQPYVAPEAEQPRWPPRFWWWWRGSRVIHDYAPNAVSPQLARVTGLPPADNTTYQEVIDEFPQFSFLLGDMHPHVLALPFALLMMALALNLYVGSARGEITSLWSGDQRAPLWPLYALAVGGLSFLNTWDFPIYAFVLAAALALGHWRAGHLVGAWPAHVPLRIAEWVGRRACACPPGRPQGCAPTTGRFNFSSFLDSVGELVVLGVTGFILYIPFYRAFTSQAAGIAPNLFNGTRAGQFFVMFGPFIVSGLLLGGAILIELVRAKRLKLLPFAAKTIGGGAGLIAAMSMGMLALTFIITRVSPKANEFISTLGNSLAQAGLGVSDHVAARLADPWVPLALGAALVAILLIWRAGLTAQPHPPAPSPEIKLRISGEGERQSLLSPDGSGIVVRKGAGGEAEQLTLPADFTLLLYAVGLLLTFGVEFAFIIDGFGTRMNTVFKFYYQAWALWSVASAFAAYYLLNRLKAAARIAVGAIVVIIVALGLLYPLLAIPDKIEKVTPTLDALEFSGQSVPDEYAAAQWLNQYVAGTPVIVEAPGEEYNPSASRFSTWTGLPSVIGWSVHEGQWRGTYEIQGPRVDAVKEIYSTPDVKRAIALMQTYQAAYLIVGPNERRQFPAGALSKFEAALPIVFQQGAVTIYQVR